MVMTLKTIILLVIAISSVTVMTQSAQAQIPSASITQDKLSGNIGDLTGAQFVDVVINEPDSNVINLKITPTESGYFETPINFVKSGNYIVTVSYGGIILSSIPYAVQSTIQTQPVYQTSNDGITVVDVFDVPFDVTITENGSVTIHNNDSVDKIVSHTGTTGTVHSGTFYKVIPAGQTRTIHFPITGSTIYQTGVYSFEDPTNGKTGTITIEKWEGSAKAIEEATVTGVTQGIVESVGIQENVIVVLKSDEDTKTTSSNIQPSSEINSAPTVIADYSIISLQNELVQSETQLTNAIESIALLKNELSDSLGTITAQQQQIVTLNSELEKGLTSEQEKTLNDTITQLESKVASLSEENLTLASERDSWKQLSDNWYAVAQQQLRVMVEILGL